MAEQAAKITRLEEDNTKLRQELDITQIIMEEAALEKRIPRTS